jgi:excisionase family DNA binding protein
MITEPHFPMPSPTTTSQPEEQFLTRQQVAKRLNVHTETVKRWARVGKLRSYVFSGTLVRHPLSDVLKLIDSALCPATVPAA